MRETRPSWNICWKSKVKDWTSIKKFSYWRILSSTERESIEINTIGSFNMYMYLDIYFFRAISIVGDRKPKLITLINTSKK